MTGFRCNDSIGTIRVYRIIPAKMKFNPVMRKMCCIQMDLPANTSSCINFCKCTFPFRRASLYSPAEITNFGVRKLTAWLKNKTTVVMKSNGVIFLTNSGIKKSNFSYKYICQSHVGGIFQGEHLIINRLDCMCCPKSIQYVHLQ